MKHVVLFTAAVFVASVLFSGCASLRPETENVTGLVYDFSGEAVFGAEIFLDGKKVSESDCYGHFSLPRTCLGKKCLLSVRKRDFEDFETETDDAAVFSSVYVKMRSFGDLLALAENDAGSGMRDSALERLARALMVRPADENALFLRAVLLCAGGDFSGAEECLSRIGGASRDSASFSELVSVVEKGLRGKGL